MKKIILILLFLTIPYSLATSHCFAVPMDSSRFKIESASVSVAGGNKSSDSYRLSDTVGQLAAGQFSSNGYVVKAGFQYLNSIIPFRFSISNTNIDFGTLAPNSPVTGTTKLTVHFDDIGNYQVTVVENGPLKTQSGNVIPDTVCNGGGYTCSELVSKIWNSTSSYGFGYNMSGDDVPDDFIDNTYFRPFPDQTAAEPPVTIMTNNNVRKNRQSIVTFKVNISSVQPAGSYQTIISFVATPSY